MKYGVEVSGLDSGMVAQISSERKEFVTDEMIQKAAEGEGFPFSHMICDDKYRQSGMSGYFTNGTHTLSSDGTPTGTYAACYFTNGRTCCSAAWLEAYNKSPLVVVVRIYKGSDTFGVYKVEIPATKTGNETTTINFSLDPATEPSGATISEVIQRDDGTWTNVKPVIVLPDGEDCPAEGDTCLVQNGANGLNQEYKYEDGEWVPLDVMKAPSNYAVIHINKGMYADEELYWLDVNGVQTWNQMDVADASIRKRLEALEEIYSQAILPVNPNDQYMITTAATLTDAKAVPCTEGKNTIVLITG